MHKRHRSGDSFTDAMGADMNAGHGSCVTTPACESQDDPEISETVTPSLRHKSLPRAADYHRAAN